MILGLHTSDQSSTAILYFTRSADLEARRKQLVPNDYKRNQKIVKALIDNTESVIRNTGFSYFLSDSDSNDLSFGEKLTQNIDHVFSKGYTNIIILGNDCPTLSEKDITQAAHILSKGHDTYGKAQDGGLYLIGLQQESYHKAIFEKLSWSTELLAQDLDHYLSTYSRELHYVSPTIKADIDNATDLITFVSSEAYHLSIYRIIIILFLENPILLFVYNEAHTSSRIKEKKSLRGPPRLAA